MTKDRDGEQIHEGGLNVTPGRLTPVFSDKDTKNDGTTCSILEEMGVTVPDKDNIMGTPKAIINKAKALDEDWEYDPGELKLKIKLGLDVHGVIDEDPVFFSELSQVVHESGGSIIIVTGREKDKELVEQIQHHKIVYTDILSITSYQKMMGTPVSYLDGRKSQPVMDPEIWNPTKAALCASAGVHIMVDDSQIYGKYFLDVKTQYILYTPEVKEFLKILFYYGGYKL